MFKITGRILLVLGLLEIIVQAALIFNDVEIKKIFSIIAFLLGFTFISLGSSFLFFNASLQTRKKAANVGIAIAVLLFAAGIISQQTQTIGARLEIIIGVFVLSLFYGPIAFKNKYDKWKVYARSQRDAFFLSTFDFLGIGFLFMGLMFKNQSWPGAEYMMTGGLVILTIGLFAWNGKFKKEVVQRKEAEDKLKITLAEVENQKQKVEEKQKEIIDSIQYAKRIQKSRMSTEKYIQQNLERLKNKR